jgi:hypothetical protein
MTDQDDLKIEVRAGDIVVTMSGTSFRVVYRKPLRGPQLVARLDYFQDQQKGSITRAEFLARAWKLANDKARELGWIACGEAMRDFDQRYPKARTSSGKEGRLYWNGKMVKEGQSPGADGPAGSQRHHCCRDRGCAGFNAADQPLAKRSILMRGQITVGADLFVHSRE